MNHKCPICNQKILKNQAQIQLHYPVRYIDKNKVIIQSNLILHLNCRLSEKGHEFLGEN